MKRWAFLGFLPLLILLSAFEIPQKKKSQHTVLCPQGCKKCTLAIEKGLKYLARRQKKNGSWRGYPDNIIPTALCTLALVSEGSTTKEGRYKDHVKRAVNFLVKKVRKSGRMGVKRYETWRIAFTILLLAELYRKDKLEPLKGKLALLKKRLERLQRKTGGWCHDLSPRVWQHPRGTSHYSEDLVAATNFVVIAIDLLEKIGIKFDQKRIKRLRKYYKRVQNRNGGFIYGLYHIWEPSKRSERGRTAGAINALLLLGEKKDSPAIKKAAKYLKKKIKEIAASPTHHAPGLRFHFPINLIPGAIACRKLGGKFWEKFVKIFFKTLTKRQRKSGQFRLSGRKGLDTAICLIVLQLGKDNLSFAR